MKVYIPKNIGGINMTSFRRWVRHNHPNTEITPEIYSQYYQTRSQMIHMFKPSDYQRDIGQSIYIRQSVPTTIPLNAYNPYELWIIDIYDYGPKDRPNYIHLGTARIYDTLEGFMFDSKFDEYIKNIKLRIGDFKIPLKIKHASGRSYCMLDDFYILFYIMDWCNLVVLVEVDRPVEITFEFIYGIFANDSIRNCIFPYNDLLLLPISSITDYSQYEYMGCLDGVAGLMCKDDEFK